MNRVLYLDSSSGDNSYSKFKIKFQKKTRTPFFFLYLMQPFSADTTVLFKNPKDIKETALKSNS